MDVVKGQVEKDAKRFDTGYALDEFPEVVGAISHFLVIIIITVYLITI